jgi:hypothetical protein
VKTIHSIMLITAAVQSGCGTLATTSNTGSHMTSSHSTTNHRYMGIELNQQVWSLLTKSDRDDRDDRRMEEFALASLYHWELADGYAPVNTQRGDWLIARVYIALENSEAALLHAEKCMALTLDLALNDFDLAYAYESLSRALALSGDRELSATNRALAEQAGAEIAKEEDRTMFMSDLEAGPWFE